MTPRRDRGPAASGLGSTLRALAGLAALFGAGLALVVNSAAPGFAGTSGATTYEFDCTSALSAGTVAPFAVTANLTGAPDASPATAAQFGVTGSLAFGLSGGFIAGFAANHVLTAAGVGLVVAGITIGSTDGTASGTFTYGHTFAQVPAVSTAIASLTWATASTTVTANTPSVFAAADVGAGLTGGAGLPTGATIVAVAAGGGSATISAATTAASTAVAGTVYAPMTFTDAGVSTSNAFTTSGTGGGHANIGLTSATSFSPVVALTVPFGGAPGVGAANCLETGYDAANAAGPSQTGATTPAFPTPAAGGTETPLILSSGGFLAQTGTTVKITPPTAAFVTLTAGGGDAAPLATDGSVNITVDQTATITLNATDTDSTPVIGYSIVAGSPTNARLILGAPSAKGVLTITDTGSGSLVVAFKFTATDGVGTSKPATEIVAISASASPYCLPYCRGQPTPPQLGLPTGPATPSGGPAITVDPSTDLADGEPVTITGTGFPANDSLVAIQCSPLAATAANASAECDLGAANLALKSDASGGFTTVLKVHTGGIGSDPAATCPPTAGDCVVAVSEASATSSVRAQANIVFSGQPASAASVSESDTLTVRVRNGAALSGADTRGTAASTSPSRGPGGVNALAITGVTASTWASALIAFALLDVGYLALSATWHRRTRRRARGRG